MLAVYCQKCSFQLETAWNVYIGTFLEFCKHVVRGTFFSMSLFCLKHSWLIATALYIVFWRGFVDIGLLGHSSRLVTHWWVVYCVVWVVVKWLFTAPNQKSPPIRLCDILVSTWDMGPMSATLRLKPFIAIFVCNIHQVVREPSMYLLLRLHALWT